MRFLQIAGLGDNNRQLCVAGELAVFGEDAVLIDNDVLQLAAFADDAVTHDDAVLQNSALADAAAGEDDGVFNSAFNDAVVCNQAVAGDGFNAVVGADFFLGLGPLQYSCLGNPMDRRTWQATVHGVAKELDST